MDHNPFRWPAVIVGAIIITALCVVCTKDKPFAPTSPIISLSAQELIFFGVAGGDNPSRQAVLVRNIGVDTLKFEVAKHAAWLDLVVVPGNGADTIFVYAYASELLAGLYSDTVMVTSDNAANSPQRFIVSLSVQPTVTVTPPVAAFDALVNGPTPPGTSVTITSAGANGIAWTATKSQSWLSISKTSGTTPDAIVVSAENSGLISGEYHDSVIITTGSPATPRLVVRVTLTITSWANFHVSGSHDLRGVQIIDAQTAVAVGFIGSATGHTGVILKTTDAGVTWNTKTYFDFTSFGGLDFPDRDHGWVVGDSAVILHTSDGGESWDQTPIVDLPIADTISLWRVHFVDVAHGWIIGIKGILMVTADSGRTWTLENSSTTFSLADIDMQSSTLGWVIGNHGTILHTTDGRHWSPQNSGSILDLWAIDMVDDLNGWIVGSAGELLRTTDGGATWVRQNSGLVGRLNDVFFVDPSTGWVVGNDGVILRYQPGTDSWLQQTSGTTRTLFNAAFTSTGYGIVVGELGTVLLTFNGGN